MSTEDDSLGPPIKPQSGDVIEVTDFPRSVQLDDGTEIPVGLPPGVDPEQAKLAVAYLKQNPSLAKNAVRHAERLTQMPAMARQLQQMQLSMMSDGDYQKRMSALREDPELKPIFDEIAGEGMDAIDKYWNDMGVMTKISKRMEEMQLHTKPERPAIKIKNLHDAAKVGDVEMLKKLQEKGQEVNQQDARGITPLGVAVGFNRIKAVEYLLEKGADVHLKDHRGNTVLHYAAGYGRIESAEMLLSSGADLSCLNHDMQTPLDVATVNGEKMMIDFLTNRLASRNDKT